MGKQITLPTDMVISDLSEIGNASLVSGKTYDVSDILISQIKNVIGAPTYKLNELCLFSGINKWAAFRPCLSTKANTYGYEYDIPSMTLLRHPATAQDGFRMGDFAGYNHLAVAPMLINPISETRYSVSENTVSATFRIGDIGPKDFLPNCAFMHLIRDTNWFDSEMDFISRYIASVITTPVAKVYNIDTVIPNFGYSNPGQGITRYVDDSGSSYNPYTLSNPFIFSVWFGHEIDSQNFGGEGTTIFKWVMPTEIHNEFTINLRKRWAYLFRGLGAFNSAPNNRDLIVRLTNQVDTGFDIQISLFYQLTDWNGQAISSGGLGDSIEVYWSPNSDGSGSTAITTIDEEISTSGTITFSLSKRDLIQDNVMYIFFNRTAF